MGTIQDILFEDQGPPSLPTAVFIKFNIYKESNITTLEGDKVVPIVPIKRSWEGKNGSCTRLQVPLCLAWAITVHKSQELTIAKANIDLEKKEFAAKLLFVVMSQVRSLSDICFKQFTFDRLERIKQCKRLQERRNKEERLRIMIPTAHE